MSWETMPLRPLKAVPAAMRDVRDVLMFRVSRLATIIDRSGQLRLSRLFELNLGEWRVLSVIHALAPVPLAEIANELCLDKGHLSRTVSLQIDAGLVCASESPSDRRQMLLALTARGRRLHDRVFKFAAARHADLMAALSAAEQKELLRLLDKVTLAAARSYDELSTRKPAAGQSPSSPRAAAASAPAPRLAARRTGAAGSG
jgi:DNA-binding MarR family transcriptional regulator